MELLTIVGHPTNQSITCFYRSIFWHGAQSGPTNFPFHPTISFHQLTNPKACQYVFERFICNLSGSLLNSHLWPHVGLMSVWSDLCTPKSDQFQISPSASPEILHHTVWRTWLLTMLCGRKTIMLPILATSPIHFLLKSWENVLFKLLFP